MSAATATGTRLAVRDLRSSLMAVAPAVGGRSSLASMQFVRMNGTTLSAANNEMMIDAPLVADIECMLPHARLLAVVSACPQDEDVSIVAKDSACVIKCAGGKWTMPTAGVDDFCGWDEGKTSAGLSLPADEMARCAYSVLPATARGVDAMSGILVDVDEETGRFVATDGHRVCISEVSHGLAVDASKTLIPHGAIAAAARIASGAAEDAEVQFRHNDSCVRITIAESVVVCRQLNKGFPDYRKIDTLPAASASVVNRHEMVAATRAAAIVSSESSRGVGFTFTAKGLTVSGKSSEYGSSVVSCPLLAFGSELSFVVNPTYVTSWLESLPVESEPHVEVDVVRGRVAMRCGDCRTTIMPIGD